MRTFGERSAAVSFHRPTHNTLWHRRRRNRAQTDGAVLYDQRVPCSSLKKYSMCSRCSLQTHVTKLKLTTVYYIIIFSSI